MSSQKQRRSGVMMAAQFSSGPLPHPDQLIKYNEAVPNAAERILVMAESQSAHRRQLEMKAISGDSARATLGLVFAFILSLTTIAGAIYLILTGEGYFGVGLFGATLAAIVSSFIYGSRQRRKERESRNN